MRTEKNLSQQLENVENQHVNSLQRLPYEVPALEVIEIEVEKGFAASLADYSDETA